MTHRLVVALAAALCLFVCAPALSPAAAQASTTSSRQARALAASAAAAAGTAPVLSAAGARAIAASILRSPRYGKATIADPVASVLAFLGRALYSIANGSPGGPIAFWVTLAVIVLGLAAYGAWRSLRRLEVARAPRERPSGGSLEDPVSLLRAAADAERAGAFEEAVRLRYRAGLLTLGARATIEYTPALLSAEVARQLGSERFDSINRDFERIAYGGELAEQTDAEAAREGWEELLSHSGDRR